MRVLLGILGAAMFLSAIFLGLCLLNSEKLSGAEFVAFVVAFTIISGVICFAPEVQEISVAGNVVKLREIKNDAIKAIEALEKTQAETLRLLLRVKPFVTMGFSNEIEHLGVNKDFWDIVSEAKRIGALGVIKPELLQCIDTMLRDVYNLAIGRGAIGSWASFESHTTFAEMAVGLLDKECIAKTARDREQDESIIREFIKIRLSELESLFELKRTLNKI